MTKVIFLDCNTISVIALDGEKFILKTYLPIKNESQQSFAGFLTKYFDECFSDDKSSMVYLVLMKMMSNHGFSFFYKSSDRSHERERIGAKIRLERCNVNKY